MESAEDFDHMLLVPVIDLSLLEHDSQTRNLVIKQIHEACKDVGVFTVINHGISGNLIEEAMIVNRDFFDLPLMTKQELISDDIHKPVRFSSTQGGVQGFSRDFLKLYAHPFQEFVDYWPKSPPDYREKMGKCAMEMRKLSIQIYGAIMESLNLEAIHLKEKIQEGVQIIASNSYRPYSESNVKNVIGAAPHSDHSIITILVQSSSGLQIMDTAKKTWIYVPDLIGSLQVLVGDHLEVLSNGKYKSVLHRVIHEHSDETRLSLASFLSLGMDEVLDPAMELVDEEHPKKYKGSSLRDFLKHLASGESKPFIETLKITSATVEEI